MIRLFDTLSGGLKELPVSPSGKTRMFVCGPTVYDYAHLGHARTYLAFDGFAKYLASRGYRLYYLQNITDVDDKIIARARTEGVTPQALAATFTKAYFEDMARIGVNSVRRYAPASSYISEIIRQIKALIAHGHAYTIPGDGIYFDITTFPAYGKLSRRTAEQAEDGISRIDESVKKRNRGDFPLWKFPTAPVARSYFRFKKTVGGEPLWNTRLGWGRPGWHIEDTAITERFFGVHYEIHGGAQDLKFPHHEAEIAQQESLSGRPLVDLWMHTGFLTIRGEKMSKSKGNFTTIRDFLREHSPLALRWLTLSHHYRSPVDYAPAVVEQAETESERIASFINRLAFVANKKENQSAANQNLRAEAEAFEKRWHAALSEDFNTPAAFAAAFDFIGSYQDKVFGLSREDAQRVRQLIMGLFGALGIQFPVPEIPHSIEQKTAERELYRRNKQFVQSDRLRNELEQLGYKVSDTPYGPLVEKLWHDPKRTT